MSGSVRRIGWIAALVLVGVLLIVGAKQRTTSGTSQDRLFALGAQLRCLQCGGESVADSSADIAVKMRTEIMAQMRKGSTDDEILGYFVDSYRERVLLNPSSSGISSAVWIIPFVVVAGGIIVIAGSVERSRRNRIAASAATTSDADRALVDAARAEAAKRLTDG